MMHMRIGMIKTIVHTAGGHLKVNLRSTQNTKRTIGRSFLFLFSFCCVKSPFWCHLLRQVTEPFSPKAMLYHLALLKIEIQAEPKPYRVLSYRISSLAAFDCVGGDDVLGLPIEQRQTSKQTERQKKMRKKK